MSRASPGFDLTAPAPDPTRAPDVIARATVSTGVIRDGILRTARTLAIGRGLIAAGGGIDRLTFAPATWDRASGHGRPGRNPRLDDRGRAPRWPAPRCP